MNIIWSLFDCNTPSLKLHTPFSYIASERSGLNKSTNPSSFLGAVEAHPHRASAAAAMSVNDKVFISVFSEVLHIL